MCSIGVKENTHPQGSDSRPQLFIDWILINGLWLSLPPDSKWESHDCKMPPEQKLLNVLPLDLFNQGN